MSICQTAKFNSMPNFTGSIYTGLYHYGLYNILQLFYRRSTVAPHFEAIKAAVSSRGDQLTPREHAYVRAVLAYASGNLLKASEEWCNMLVEFPLGQ